MRLIVQGRVGNRQSHRTQPSPLRRTAQQLDTVGPGDHDSPASEWQPFRQPGDDHPTERLSAARPFEVTPPRSQRRPRRELTPRRSRQAGQSQGQVHVVDTRVLGEGGLCDL